MSLSLCVSIKEIGHWTHSKRKTCLQMKGEKSGVSAVFVLTYTYLMRNMYPDIVGVRRCDRVVKYVKVIHHLKLFQTRVKR